MLKRIYDYMSGYMKRSMLESLVEKKSEEIEKATHSNENNEDKNNFESEKSSKTKVEAKYSGNLAKEVDETIETETKPDDLLLNIITDKNINNIDIPQINNDEKSIDKFYRIKEELLDLEKKLKEYNQSYNNRKIHSKDIEIILKKHNVMLSKRVIDQMIWGMPFKIIFHIFFLCFTFFICNFCYIICLIAFILIHVFIEIDENSDNFIDWEEFQLAYYRNIAYISGNEPSLFFHITEVSLIRIYNFVTMNFLISF